MKSFQQLSSQFKPWFDRVLESWSKQSDSLRRRSLASPHTIESLETRCLLAAVGPQLTVADVTLVEGNDGEQTAVVTVSLNETSTLPVTARFATRNRTATAGSDFQSQSGTLTLLPGQTSATISVVIMGDVRHEKNETFEVYLSAPTNATILKGIGTLTLTNDDLPPVITAVANPVVEGTAASLIISLSSVSDLPVTVSCTTSNLSALAAADYIAVTRSITIPAGTKSATVSLTTRQDVVDEPDETFLVSLSSPMNATLSNSSVIVTIMDNDPPAITIADVVMAEGTATASTVTMVVSLSSASPVPINVTYATRDRTAIGVTDYQRNTGVLTIPAGATSATLSVSIVADNLFERDETFGVLLSLPANATITKAFGTVTIVDDDPLPIVSVEDQAITEGNAGSQATSIRVNLNQPALLPVTLNYHTIAISAVSGSDFVSVSGMLTIPAGASGGTIMLATLGDVLDEADETLSIEISSAVNATVSGSPNVLTIVDNDLPPLVSIANLTVAEGNAGPTSSTIEVNLSAVSGLPVTVNFRATATTASVGSDFLNSHGTLTIPAGDIRGFIKFDVVGDSIDEPNEAFEIRLGKPVNVRFSKSLAIVTILDDDGATLPLFNASRDLNYVGAFRVPSGIVGSDTFEFGGNALAFNSANGSLFMASNVDHGLNIAEVQIPSILSSTGVVSSMSVASVLQSFVRLSSLLTTDAGGIQQSPRLNYEDLGIGGLLVTGNGLTGSMFMGYNGAEPQSSTHSHFRTTGLNLANLSASNFSGLIDIRSNSESASGRVRAGYMAEVPEQWKAWIGANHVTGAAGQNRIQYSSSGPALFGFDATNPAASSDKPLVYYPYGRALQWVEGRTSEPQLLFNGTTQVNGVAFVPGTRSVIFIGSNGVSSIGYGVGSTFNDRARPYQGFHSQNGNYQYQIWAYDIDDFVSVRNGTLKSWEVRPTSVVNFNLPTPEASKYLGGTAFDPATGRLYVSQKTAGPAGTPIIHVYQLGSAPVSGVLSYQLTRGSGVPTSNTTRQLTVFEFKAPSTQESSAPADRLTKLTTSTKPQIASKRSATRESRLTTIEARHSIKRDASTSLAASRIDELFSDIGDGQLAILQ